MKKRAFLLSLLMSISFGMSVFANETSDLISGKNIIKEIENPNTKVTDIQLLFLIKAPQEKVWDVLADYSKYHEFMPIKEAKIKSKTGNTEIVFIRPETPAMIDVSYDLKRVYEKDKWLITFEKHAGKIKSINGYWKLEPFKTTKYTKVIYVNNIDIGMPVPGFVKDYFTKGSLVKLADAVRKRVESGETWKK